LMKFIAFSRASFLRLPVAVDGFWRSGITTTSQCSVKKTNELLVFLFPSAACRHRIR
jgi:hypothetical protein